MRDLILLAIMLTNSNTFAGEPVIEWKGHTKNGEHILRVQTEYKVHKFRVPQKTLQNEDEIRKLLDEVVEEVTNEQLPKDILRESNR